MPVIKTIGDLKKAIEKLDDNVEIVQASSNYEQRGALKLGTYISEDKYSTRQTPCRDDFDGTCYTITEYVPDENGETKIKFG